MRWMAVALIALVVAAALLAPALAPFDYSRQFREAPNAPPGGMFLMGTDDLGRDRFSRLLYATRVSILLAPAAALVSIVMALAISAIPARRTTSAFATLCLSLPWIFLFLILRSILPLNTKPLASMLLTFALMGLAGWAWPARIFSAAMAQMQHAGWLLQARASGLTGWRIAAVHTWPHLRGLAIAQFRILVPAYILSEASLGLLGLGVAEPLPSWGNLLAELQHPGRVQANPWILAPLILLMLVMIAFEALQPVRETLA
jgi:peptide/nickel transport system permease protein